MPHFNLKPEGWKIGDLLKGTIPEIGIDWYAKGGILTKPTVFGMNGSNDMIGGEAGKEAVAPISTLQKYVAEAVGAANNQGEYQSLLEEGIKKLDDIVNRIEKTETSVKFNHREMARVMKSYAG